MVFGDIESESKVVFMNDFDPSYSSQYQIRFSMHLKMEQNTHLATDH